MNPLLFHRTLTPRLIRQTIEKQLGLEEASLDASEYKSAIKSATKSALVSYTDVPSRSSVIFICLFRMRILLQKRKRY